MALFKKMKMPGFERWTSAVGIDITALYVVSKL